MHLSIPSLLALALLAAPVAAADGPFAAHGPVRVAKAGTHLEHADGTPFFFLADTVWTGPALSTPEDWQTYLKDRVAKGFTAVQFNAVSPWRTAPTDAEGRQAYTREGGKFAVNTAFFDRVEARLKAVNDAGLLAVPVLAWAHKAGDAGVELSEPELVELIRYELGRYRKYHCLYILAGDNRYRPDETERWKRIGRAVFADFPDAVATTHPTGTNFPWKGWEGEKWLSVLGYQSGHGDDAKTWKWLHSGPPAEYGRRAEFTRPVINLEPPYEGHNGYQTRTPHGDLSVRRAIYWSLLVTPTAGVTYGGHGVWSWHAKPGEEPTDHKGSGVAKPWREALDMPAAGQMKHLRALFDSLPWTKLRPTPDLLAEQPGDKDAARFVAVAATPDRGVVVAYVPEGEVKLDARRLTGRLTAELFDPATGERRAVAAEPGADGVLTVTVPNRRDGVVILRR